MCLCVYLDINSEALRCEYTYLQDNRFVWPCFNKKDEVVAKLKKKTICELESKRREPFAVLGQPFRPSLGKEPVLLQAVEAGVFRIILSLSTNDKFNQHLLIRQL